MFSIKDIPIRRNEDLALKFLKSYARNIGTQCSDQVIIEDVGLNKKTGEKYFDVLERLFVIDEVLARNGNLRSKTAVRTRNTRYFVDPSIATSCLNLSPESLFKDMKYFGFLFESLVMRDLRIYAEAHGGAVYHYRDSYDREADAVIVYKNGDFALVEIKLGGYDEASIAANKLLAIADDLVEKPIYLMVITATNVAYRRDDGVYVIPLAILKD